MQRLEVSGAVRPIYGSLGVKRLMSERQERILSVYTEFVTALNCITYLNPVGLFCHYPVLYSTATSAYFGVTI